MALNAPPLPLNSICASLAHLVRQRLLERKVLIAPNRRVGHQWVESVVRSGVPVVNLHVETTTALALSLAAEEIARSGRTLASKLQREALLEILWAEFAAADGGYLRTLPASAPVAAALARTIEDVRLAGLRPDDLDRQAFESGVKGSELAEFLSRYERGLADHGLLDRADVLRMACRALVARRPLSDEKSPGTGALADVYAIADETRLTALERELLDRLPEGRLAVLATDALCPGEPLDAPRSDRARLAWLPRPAEAPAPVGDGSVSLFAAVGEANEVREALRRCLAAHTSLDEVEFVCTDSDTYGPLVRDALGRLADGRSDDGADSEEAPPRFEATYADGLPVRLSRPGRALAAWLEWSRSDHPQLQLVRMLADGLLAAPGDDADPGNRAALARELRSLPVLFGLDRYLTGAEEALEAARRRQGSGAVLDEHGETLVPDDELEGQVARLETLRAWLRETVLRACPAAEATPVELLGAAARWVTEVAWSRTDLDRYARDVLAKRIEDVRSVLAEGATDTPAAFDAWSLLAELVKSARVVGVGPQPGRLHVSSLASGGHSGRRHTFVLGLDDGRFPGAGLQDPLLLDTERRGLADDLPTAAGELEERSANLARLLAGLRGEVTLSFPLYDVVEGREAFPASAMVSAYRLLTGRLEAGQESLLAEVQPGAAFLPDEPHRALDSGELEAWRLIREPGADLPAVLLADRPHLARGLKAREARASDAHTRYDGRIAELASTDDPTHPAGPVLSAGRLETAGACPLRYFFRHVLGVAPLDEPTVEGDRWLDAMQQGTLLHQVFCDFLRRLAGRPGPIAPMDHADLLQRVLESHIADYRERYPPASPAAYEVQRAELEESCRLFLRAESEYFEGRRPAYMEVTVGMWPEGVGTDLDRNSPLAVVLSEDVSLRVRGKIDRIDRVDGDPVSWALWDYKTGSSWRYEQDPPLFQGRVLQSVVYWLMAESLLAGRGPVSEVGYTFPSPKGKGLRIGYHPEDLAEGRTVLSRLARLIADGAFCQTNDKGDCHFCDYAAVCGVPEENAAAGGRMLASPDNDHLAGLRVLRGLEDD